jgi:hypothetical protein
MEEAQNNQYWPYKICDGIPLAVGRYRLSGKVQRFNFG